MSVILESRNLSYSYEDGTQALNGVDFTLAAGQTIALLGANGSGKTTFALACAGLLEGYSGEIKVDGIVLTRATQNALRPRIGLLFQDPDEQLFMPTVLEDVAFGPANLGLSALDSSQRALEALEQTGMAHASQKAPYHLSAGEKRRVALAGILAMRPSVMILDEPTTYLDPPAQRALVNLLGGMPQAKLIVTHDIPFAAALAPDAVFFEKGRIAGSGSLTEIVTRFDWGYSPPDALRYSAQRRF